LQYISKKTHTFANNMKVKQFTYKWITFTIIYFCLYDVIWALADYEDFKKAYKDYCVWLLIDLAYCALFSFTSILINQMLFKLRRFHTIKNGLSFFIINSVFVIASNLLTAGVCETLIAYFDPAIIENDIWGTSFLFGIISSLIALIYLSLYYSEMAIKNNNDKLSLQKKYLKLQLDPHFVFNGLSSLVGMIKVEPKKAETYVIKFSHIYRHMLQHIDKDYININEATDFLTSYVDLLNVRFDNNIIIKINYEKKEENNKEHILSLSLQLLIENAVKHNSPDTKHKLIIQIYKTDDNLIVSNNRINPKEITETNAESFKIGLINLQRRYMLENNKSISVHISPKTFQVALPIIKF